jgi:succinyl-CoA synthetase beta subunit
MNLHEYEAKNLLARYGVPIPPYGVATSADEAFEQIKELGLTNEVMIKVQIHAGGRGKAGGVKLAKNPEEAVRIAGELIGMKIINNQTGSKGVVANKVILYAPVNIQQEYYLAATIDRSQGAAILLASPEGGMEIEQIAKEYPERLLKIPIGLDGRLHRYHLLTLSKFMRWTGRVQQEGIDMVTQLARAFVENDTSLIEINPLVLTKEGHLTVVDAKITVDDNALYRHPALVQWYDPTQSTANEVMAKEFDLAYIGLDGEIGCLVNGAGLAMATMDIIHHYGGAAANFLDVGGGATQEEIAHGFNIILCDPQVKVIFVNIFGGIMDCSVLAQGIVQACTQEKLSVPLIVRMEGTNVEMGKKILKDSRLSIVIADTMADGAEKAVKVTAGK